MADEVTAIDCDGASAPATTTPSDVTTARSEIDLDCLQAQLNDGVAFPVGWDDVDTALGGWVFRGLGWRFVATAVARGAPFWFDLLGRTLARRRSKPALEPFEDRCSVAADRGPARMINR